MDEPVGWGGLTAWMKRNGGAGWLDSVDETVGLGGETAWMKRLDGHVRLHG